jgi:hypothetical protein
LPHSKASSTRRFAPVALLAWLTAACGYPDVALTPPERAPHLPDVAATEGEDASRGEFGLGTPFVVIRFGPEPADPDVKFHLLAVAATGGPPFGRDASLGHAEAVLRSLAALGVPPDEVFITAVAAPERRIDEVRLYLR